MHDPNAKHLGEHGEEEPSGELDALFSRARDFPPSDAQLAAMLRAADPGRARARRFVIRAAGGVLAAAAVIAAAVLLIAPPGQPQALALSAVSEAMRKVTVIKSTDPDGTVQWSGNCIYAQATDGGRGLNYWNMRACERATFDFARGSVILSSSDPWLHDCSECEGNAIDRLVRQAERFGLSFEQNWDREDVVVDGQPMILLTTKKGQPWLGYFKYGIDPTTGRISWAENNEGRVRYEYPAQVPQDIYDLGAPRQAPVLDWRADRDILAVRDRAVEAMHRPFGNYRFVKLDTSGRSDSFSLLTDGQRYRIDSVSISAEPGLAVEDLARTAVEALRRDPNDKSRATFVCDGEWETHLIRDNDGVPRSRYVVNAKSSVRRLDQLGSVVWMRDLGVFFGPYQDQKLEYLGINEKGWVGLRRLRQGGVFGPPESAEEWFDPCHGYLITRRFSIADPNASWQLRSDWQRDYIRFTKTNPNMVFELPDEPAKGVERETLEWGELRPGVWYPVLVRMTQLIQGEDGDWHEGTLDSQSLGSVHEGEVRPRPASADPRRFGPSVSYQYILAKPLDEMRDEWFEVPAEWEDVPLRRG